MSMVPDIRKRWGFVDACAENRFIAVKSSSTFRPFPTKKGRNVSQLANPHYATQESILEECQAMLQHALSDGKEVSGSVLQIIKPTKPQTVMFMREEGEKSGRRNF